MMSKISKRAGVLMLASTMLIASLAGCGAPKDSTPAAKDGDKASADGTVDTSKEVEIVWYHLGDAPTNGQLAGAKEEWDKILKEKVNATLSINFIEWADYVTKYNLLLASGEKFDMINTASDWLDMWPNAQKGAFKDITEMLPKYAPQTWKEVTPEHWDQCKYNGKIITIPEDQYTQWINHGFMYRGDWAKEFGITEPITNWTTMGEYFQKAKDVKGVVPFDCDSGQGVELADGWMMSNTDSVMLEVPTAFFYSKSVDNIATVYSPYMDDEIMIPFAETMKKWGDAGYWRTDVLNYKGNLRDSLKAGTTSADQHHVGTYAGLRVDMDEKQPGSDLQFFAFNSQGKKNLTRMSITHGAQAVAASSANPERALMVYDLIRNDKTLYELMNYGRKDINYAIKEDGTRTLPEGYNETDDSFFSNFWGGRMDKFDIPSDRTYSKIGDVYKEFDTYATDYPYAGFVFDKTPVDSYISALSDVRSRNVPAMTFGKLGDPTEAVNKFQDELKAAGLDTVMAEVQKQLDAWKAKK